MSWRIDQSSNLELSQGETGQTHLIVAMFRLKQPLDSRLFPGNNKAALFELLAYLSNALYKETRIFWGVCGMRRTMMVAYQCPVPAARDDCHRMTSLLNQTMRDAVEDTPLLYSAPFAIGVVSPVEALVIKNATLHLLMSLMLRTRSHMPGAWDTSSPGTRLPILDDEIILERHHFTPSSLAIPSEDCVMKEQADAGTCRNAEQQPAKASRNGRPDEDDPEEGDWVYVEEEDVP